MQTQPIVKPDLKAATQSARPISNFIEKHFLHFNAAALVDAAKANDVAIFCYGTVAGGFLSERWLGQAEPAGPLANRSLTKYKLIIDEFGGWADVTTKFFDPDNGIVALVQQQ